MFLYEALLLDDCGCLTLVSCVLIGLFMLMVIRSHLVVAFNFVCSIEPQVSLLKMAYCRSPLWQGVNEVRIFPLVLLHSDFRAENFLQIFSGWCAT